MPQVRLLIAGMAHIMAFGMILTTVLPRNAAAQMKRVLNGQNFAYCER
jgi:hypothetical protein